MRALALFLAIATSMAAADWPRFRGPNGSGVAETGSPPIHFGPTTNVIWKTALPQGHSSPIISGDRIFLTGAEGGEMADVDRKKVTDKGGKLFTMAVDRSNGEILWKKQAPRPRFERYQPTNSSASPSPAVDGENVYVFFGDFGLISYTFSGEERWRAPLGPFNNVNGHGSSPIVVGDMVILACDQDTDGYLLAVDKDSGQIRWKTDRSETTRTYVTPAVYRPAEGPVQLIVPAAYFIASYSADTGEKLWWALGGGWQPKSTPVVDGDSIYVSSWEGGGGRPASDFLTFAQALERADANNDGQLSEPEYTELGLRGFENTDLSENGFLDQREWGFLVARMTSRSSLTAIRLPGRGDVTASAVPWSLEKFLPNAPTPLLYRGVLYLVKDGGILSSLDPATGEILKQGRLSDALDKYYASPVAADGRIYVSDQTGKATVIRAGAQWRATTSKTTHSPPRLSSATASTCAPVTRFIALASLRRRGSANAPELRD